MPLIGHPQPAMPRDRRQNKSSQQRRVPPYFPSIQATPHDGSSSGSQPTPGARRPGLPLEDHTLPQGPHHADDPSLPRLCGLPAIRVKMINHPLVDEHAVVYSSPNAPSLPTVLPSYPPIPCDDIRTLAYRGNHDFYLAFIPQCMHLGGGLLHHINYNRSNLPVEERNAGFCLAESLASEWIRLESQLVAIEKLMTQIVGLMPPKNFAVPEPKSYGYTHSFATRLDALNAICLSMEAFLGLSACISFLIALCKQRYPPDTFWSTGLSELSLEVKGKDGVSRKAIDDSLIESLKQTPFFSDHKLVPRVGALIDVSYDLEWHKYIPAFVLAYVPLWFRLGPYSNYMQQCSTKIYDKSLFDKAELDVIVKSMKRDLLDGIQSKAHHMPCALPAPREGPDVQETISPPTTEVTDARRLSSILRTQDLPPGRYQTFDSLENILRDRYSFVHQEHPLQETILTSQLVCAQIFVHNESAGDDFPSFLLDSFRQFTDALCRGSPLNDVPFYALNPIYRSSFTTQLRSISNDMFSIHPQLYNAALGGRQGYGYIIKATDPKASPGWELSVDNPLTALQIIRSNWGPSLCDVAIALVSRGIPFNTFLRNPTLQYNHQYRQKWHELAPTPIHTPPGVIFARLNTLECYTSYVEARDEFLKDTRHIRAALLQGGIVWRLAIDILEPGIVLKGPSEFFELTGKPYLLGEDEMWDDTLSESELDFICGVFRVPKLGM